MKSVLRHVRAISLLPGMVAIVLPAILVLVGGLRTGLGLSHPYSTLVAVLGENMLLVGLTLLIATNVRFAAAGQTLAPWDETTKIVMKGLYLHLRNPMILGVCLILLGEGLLFSWWILGELVLFVAGQAIFIHFFEEPELAQKFGAPYEKYRHNVPAWLPRVTPWDGR